MKTLAEILPHNNILEVIDLSKNFLGVSGACELSVALKNNKTLKYLNLFNNKIAYDGAKAVAENIVLNSPSLEFLELGHNRIRDKGLKAIGEAIVSNKQTVLKILCFRFNFITNSGAEKLIRKVLEKPNRLE
jgi:NLR family CARD domain-containing protein 3